MREKLNEIRKKQWRLYLGYYDHEPNEKDIKFLFDTIEQLYCDLKETEDHNEHLQDKIDHLQKQILELKSEISTLESIQREGN